MSSQTITSTSRPSYRTRLRARLESVSEKYDDIFAAVLSQSNEPHVEPPSQEKQQRPAPRSQLKQKQQQLKKEGEAVPSNVDRFTCMACDFSCNLHDSLHEHIATAHAHAGRLVRCSKCGRHEGYVCRFCGIFSAQLNEHLVEHYRDRVGPGALMECQRCPKTFTTVEAVREHERRLHGAPSALSTPSQQSHGCGLCENRFPTRQSRDIHLVMNHHQQFVNKCWGEVERQLTKEASPTNTYQCILCRRSILGRKTYRLHFIHRHIVAEVAVMSGGAKNEPVDHDVDEPDSVTKIRNVVLAVAQQIVTGCGGKEKLRAQSPVSSQNEAPISVADYDVPMMLDPDV